MKLVSRIEFARIEFEHARAHHRVSDLIRDGVVGFNQLGEGRRSGGVA